MRKIFRVSALLLCTVFLFACVRQQQVNLLERRLSDQEQQILALNNSLGSTSKALDNVRPEQADLWSEVKGMKVSLATIEGQVEDLQTETSSVATIEADLAEIKARTAQIENSIRLMASQLGIESNLPAYKPKAVQSPNAQQGTQQNPVQFPVASNGKVVPAAPSVPTAPVAPSAKPAPPVVAPKDLADALYKSALQAFNERRYADAQRMWSEYEKTYPKSKLAPNAAFWQGEAYYQLKDYPRAILAYEEVLQNYPKSNKYPQALLKQGLSFFRQGQKEPAKLRLNQLIKKFPKSAAAKRAKQELAKK
ncbi:MAG: tol-pal system protein YbgF [Desulfovibrionales bacterium]|nr:tol-pal system protein YbgF [Desulfovibrionales bacterium]